MKKVIIILLSCYIFLNYQGLKAQTSEEQLPDINSAKTICIEVIQSYEGVTNLNLSYDELVNGILSFVNLKVLDNTDSICDLNLLIEAKGSIKKELNRLVFSDSKKNRLQNVYKGVRMQWQISIKEEKNTPKYTFTESLRLKYLSFDPKANYESSIKPVIKGYQDILWTGLFIENFGKFIAKTFDLDELDLFTHVLGNKNMDIRSIAIQIIEDSKDPRSFDRISQLQNDSDVDIRVQAINSLVKLGGDRMVEPLILALNDNEHKIRIQSAIALGNLGDTLAVAPLIQLLNDETNTSVISCTAVALGKLGDITATDPIYYSINKVPKYRRPLITIALGKLGDPRAVEHLIPILKGRYKAEEALKLLKQLTGQDFGSDYKKWKKWYKNNYKNVHK